MQIHIIKERKPTLLTELLTSMLNGGDAASWLVMQANYDLKTPPTLEDIERKVAVCEQLAA